MGFSEMTIDALRTKICSSMSEWRFVHTAEVEKMAVRLGELYLADKIPELRVAALLHDITKEKSTDEQIEILISHQARVGDIDRLSPKTLHARTAELVAIDEYPELATPEILSAIRRHTTGHAEMTLFDAVIYLADYIDMSRKFDDCVRLREYFWSKEPHSMSVQEREQHLWETVLLSLDMTLKALTDEGAIISVDSVEARNAIICRLKK